MKTASNDGRCRNQKIFSVFNETQTMNWWKLTEHLKTRNKTNKIKLWIRLKYTNLNVKLWMWMEKFYTRSINFLPAPKNERKRKPKDHWSKIIESTSHTHTTKQKKKFSYSKAEIFIERAIIFFQGARQGKAKCQPQPQLANCNACMQVVLCFVCCLLSLLLLILSCRWDEDDDKKKIEARRVG